MKKLIIFAYFFLMAGVSASAQDVLITKDGDVKNVYEVEVGTNAVFYKSEDKADAAILRINKTNVYMIKRKDGTKYDLGNEVSVKTMPTNIQTSTPANVTVSSDSQKRNADLINQINGFNPKYVGDDTDKDAKRLFCIFGYGKDSQVVNDELEVECVTGSMYCYDSKKTVKKAVVNGAVSNDVTIKDYGTPWYANPCIRLKLKNRSTKTLYIDLGNTFMTRNGVATAYYIPSSTSTSSSNSSGASVNLGAVAGALGVGGVLGTLASGIAVGGGNTSGTVNTIYSQRVIAVPPMSVKELDAQMLFLTLGKFCDGFNVFEGDAYDWIPNFWFDKKDGDYKNGETHDFSESTSPIKFGFFVSYYDNEACQTERKMSFNLYLRRTIGFGNGTAYKMSGAGFLPKKIPEYNKCISFVGMLSMEKSPKTPCFKRGDK